MLRTTQIDTFVPDFQDPWKDFRVLKDSDAQVTTCVKSPSYESDSGMSSFIGSPTTPHFCDDQINWKSAPSPDLSILDKNTDDLLSFMMRSNENDPCNTQKEDLDEAEPTTINVESVTGNVSVSSSEAVINEKLEEGGRKPILSTPVAMKPAIVKLVRLVSPVSTNTACDTGKNVEDKNKKNALHAKINRERKKIYMKNLESEVSSLKTDNNSLRKEARQLRSERNSLSEQVDYLKSVLANESALSQLLKNIPVVSNVKLSSMMRSKRMANQDDDVEISPKKAKLTSGVCLHVDNDLVSLEFCSHCAKMAAR